MKANEHTSKDIQTAVIKMWELVKNVAETTKESAINSNEAISKFHNLERNIHNKDAEITELKALIDKYQVKFASLEQQNEQILKEFSPIKEKANKSDDLEKIISNLLIEKEDLEQKNALLKEKANFIPVLTEEINLLKEEKSSLIEKITENNIIIQNLQKVANDFEFAQKDISRKNIDLNDRTLEIQKLKDDYADAQSVIFRLRRKEIDLADSLDKIVELEKQLIDFDCKYKELSNHYETEKVGYFALKSSLDEEIKELKHIIHSHEQTISELMGQVLQYQTHTDEYNNLSNSLNNNLKSTINEWNNTKQELEDANNKINSLVLELESANNNLVELERLKNLEKENNDYIELLENEIANLKQSTQQFSNEIDYFKVMTEELTKKNNILSLELNEEKNNFALLNQSLNLKADFITEKEAKIAELNAKLSTIQNKLENEKKLNNELSVELMDYNILKNRFDILDEEYDRCNKENGNLQEQNRTLKNDISSFESEIKRYHTQNETLISDINCIQTEFENFKLAAYDFDAIKSESFELKEKLRISNDIINEFNSELAAKAEQFHSLSVKYDNLLSEWDRMKYESENLNSQVIDLEQNVATLIEKINNYDLVISESDRLISLQNEQFEELNNELEQLTNTFHQLSILEEEISNLRSIIENNEAIIQNKDEEINSLKILLETPISDEKFFSVEKTMNDLKTENTLKELLIKDLQYKIESLEELLKTRYKHIRILELELDEINKNNNINGDNTYKNELIQRIEGIIAQLENN